MLSKDVELATVKTVVGFLNSENGGTLIIGISDSKEVLGLQADYASFKGAKHDRDVFELRLRQILMDVIGVRRCARWVKTGFCSLLGKELCVVTVAPSSDPVFIKDGTGVPQLYVRVGNSTRAFGVQEALTYAEDRWGRIALPWLNTRRNIPHPVG
jgi:predicted HTH transcriptional regulator